MFAFTHMRLVSIFRLFYALKATLDTPTVLAKAIHSNLPWYRNIRLHFQLKMLNQLARFDFRASEYK